jgi:hypothetical protein
VRKKPVEVHVNCVHMHVIKTEKHMLNEIDGNMIAIIIQSAFQEKVPTGGWRLWCSSGGKFTGGWTKGLLLVENSMMHQRVTLLDTE